MFLGSCISISLSCLSSLVYDSLLLLLFMKAHCSAFFDPTHLQRDYQDLIELEGGEETK